MKKMGFVQIKADPCIYTAATGEMFIKAVYVVDFLLAGRNNKQIIEVKKMLAKHFEIKDVCELTHFLGVKIVQKSDTGEIWIGQNVPKNVLEKLEMENSKPVSTLELKLSDDEGGLDPRQFQSAVGSLLYLLTITRLGAFTMVEVEQTNSGLQD